MVAYPIEKPKDLAIFMTGILLEASMTPRILAALLACAACSRSEPPPQREPTSALAPSVHYSPFLLRVSGAAPFRIVSFKDVGITSATRALRPLLYEAIAHSLAHQLNSDPSRALSSDVDYSEEIADPANHTHCESEHIYVDIWQSQQPPRWGYSLWSGCGEDEQFAWEELAAPAGDDLIGKVEPLTRQIASSLREAVDSGCFRKSC